MPAMAGADSGSFVHVVGVIHSNSAIRDAQNATRLVTNGLHAPPVAGGDIPGAVATTAVGRDDVRPGLGLSKI